MQFAAVRWSLMAQSGHSRHRNILSAIGQERTLTGSGRLEIRPNGGGGGGVRDGVLGVLLDAALGGHLQRDGVGHRHLCAVPCDLHMRA